MMPDSDLRIERTRDGWSIRVPIHAEEVRVEKRRAIYDVVEIHREGGPEVSQRAETPTPNKRHESGLEEMAQREPPWVRMSAGRRGPQPGDD